ncbi:hypothetical protein [Roseivivax halodurans]|uniref:hypothetical protein n=1 Tax=Roseivivax halodurans TaxID=93683 RepID=UPI0012FA0E67|nr:hypothetical protein [Roseivivax halodurans]
MKHSNGHEWEAAREMVNGCACYVMSNKNPLKHRDVSDGSSERGNEKRFHIYCPDERSVINGLQAGLSIRMVGIGNNNSRQTNLFKADGILIDGKPLLSVEP